MCSRKFVFGQRLLLHKNNKIIILTPTLNLTQTVSFALTLILTLIKLKIYPCKLQLWLKNKKRIHEHPLFALLFSLLALLNIFDINVCIDYNLGLRLNHIW